MADWTLLYHHRLGVRPKEVAPCYAQMERLAAIYPGRIIFCEKDTPLGYSEALRDYWHVKGDLVSVEHDMEISQAALEEMIACPHPACGWSYWIYPPSSGHTQPYATALEEFTPHTAAGFIRLSEGIRQGAEFPIVHWAKVEWALDQFVQKSVGRWHNHGPASAVPHHHGLHPAEWDSVLIPR